MWGVSGLWTFRGVWCVQEFYVGWAWCFVRDYCEFAIGLVCPGARCVNEYDVWCVQDFGVDKAVVYSGVRCVGIWCVQGCLLS